MDSFWSNKSNGRLEREYFDGISKALTNDKPLRASAKPAGRAPPVVPNCFGFQNG
jgi:hypothetical protein